jgi:RsiW-degrading membrane proteinase PrsW (M82 family)
MSRKGARSSLNVLLGFAGILPTIIIVWYILRFDRFEKEPKALLLRLFIWGCVVIIPAAVLEMMIELDYDGSKVLMPFLDAFSVGLIEEFVKYVIVITIAYRKSSYNEIYDGIIYCVFVSLGFASVENLLYVFSSGYGVALFRAITAVPAHAIFAVSMGYNLSLSKIKRFSAFYKFKAYAGAVCLHTLYDFLIFMDLDIGLLIFVPYLIWMYYRSIKLIKTTSQYEPFE